MLEMEITKNSFSLAMMVAIIAVLLTTSFIPFALARRHLQPDIELPSESIQAIAKPQKGLRGEGDLCQGQFCMFRPHDCAGNCGCLYPIGVCYGTDCPCP